MQRAHGGELAGDAGRRGAARPPVGDELDERRRRRPTPATSPCVGEPRRGRRRGRGGRRRSCWPPVPVRRPATTGTPRSPAGARAVDGHHSASATLPVAQPAVGEQDGGDRLGVTDSVRRRPSPGVLERQVDGGLCASSGPCRQPAGRPCSRWPGQIVITESVRPGDGRLGQQVDAPGRQAGLLPQLRRAISAVGSSVDVTHPGGDLDRITPRTAGATGPGGRPTGCPRRPRPAAPRRRRRASARCRGGSTSPDGPSKSATTTRQTWPWWTSHSPRQRRNHRTRQTSAGQRRSGGGPALGAQLEGGADQGRGTAGAVGQVGS